MQSCDFFGLCTNLSESPLSWSNYLEDFEHVKFMRRFDLFDLFEDIFFLQTTFYLILFQKFILMLAHAKGVPRSVVQTQLSTFQAQILL